LPRLRLCFSGAGPINRLAHGRLPQRSQDSRSGQGIRSP